MGAAGDPIGDALLALPARSPARLLEALAQVARVAGPRGRRPVVRLGLRSGRELHGAVLAVGEGPTRTVVLHLLGPDGRRWEGDAAWIELGDVESVVVLDAPAWLDVLTDGQVAPPVLPPAGDEGGPPPTRLALRRHVADQARALAGRVGHEVALELPEGELPPEALRRLQLLVDDVVAVLTELSLEELGRAALAAVSTLRFVGGPRPHGSREGAVLVLEAPFDRGRAPVERAEVRAALEAAL